MKINHTTHILTLALGLGLATQAFANTNIDPINSIRSQKDAVSLSTTAPAESMDSKVFQRINALRGTQHQVSDAQASNSAQQAGSFNNDFVVIRIDNNK